MIKKKIISERVNKIPQIENTNQKLFLDENITFKYDNPICGSYKIIKKCTITKKIPLTLNLITILSKVNISEVLTMGFRDRLKNMFDLGKSKDSVHESESGEVELAQDKKVLFVCTGNVIRSPIAEAIFNHKAKNQKAFSAGLYAQNGDEASHNAILAILMIRLMKIRCKSHALKNWMI